MLSAGAGVMALSVSYSAADAIRYRIAEGSAPNVSGAEKESHHQLWNASAVVRTALAILLLVTSLATAQDLSHQTVPNVKGYQLSAAKYALAISYGREGYWLYVVTTAYTLILICALVRWRVAPRLRSWAERVSPRPWIQLLLYGPGLFLLFVVLLLPTNVYGQWHFRTYGMSVQNWGSWFLDWSGMQIAAAIAGTLIIGLLYFVIRRSPRRWWLYLWLIGVPLAVLVVFVQPILIDPLFNTLEPLGKAHPDLVDSAERLLARAGLVIPPEHIYLVKVSGKTTEADAYSEGLGPTKGIFIDDTLIATESSAVILVTLGHEIGHFMLSLDWIAFGISIPLLLILLYFMDRVIVWLLARWGDAWNIRGPQDWASLPVFALFVVLISIVLTPAANTLSRYREHEADRCGLELIHGIVPNGGEEAAQAFQKDGEANLSDPAPPEWIKWWLFDHPPVNERIIFCRTYNPWSKGQQPKYVR